MELFKKFRRGKANREDKLHNTEQKIPVKTEVDAKPADAREKASQQPTETLNDISFIQEMMHTTCGIWQHMTSL